MRELERFVALDIVGSYHQSVHRSLGRPLGGITRARFLSGCHMIGDDFGLHFYPRRSALFGRPVFTYLVCATGRPLSAQMSDVQTAGCSSNTIHGIWRASSYDAHPETL
jgi:hypothetical protein